MIRQVIKLKNSAKIQILEFFSKLDTQHTFWSWLMCKYEMDPANIVEDTERTRLNLQTDV